MEAPKLHGTSIKEFIKMPQSQGPSVLETSFYRSGFETESEVDKESIIYHEDEAVERDEMARRNIADIENMRSDLRFLHGSSEL